MKATPLIIDAASYCSRPYPSPEANYTAVLAVCAKLLKRGITFMCFLDPTILGAYATERWSLRLHHFSTAFPFWFFPALKGADIIEEIKRASISLNSRVVSARLPLVHAGSTAFEIDNGTMWLRAINLRVGLGQPFEVVTDQVKQRLLHEDRYKHHIVAAAASADDEPSFVEAAA